MRYIHLIVKGSVLEATAHAAKHNVPFTLIRQTAFREVVGSVPVEYEPQVQEWFHSTDHRPEKGTPPGQRPTGDLLFWSIKEE